MASDKKPDNRDPNEPRNFSFALLLLVVIFLGSLFAISSRQVGGSWVSIFPSCNPFRHLKSSPSIPQRNPEKIEKLEAKGGSKATRKLIRLLYLGKIHHEDRELAFDALSNIARSDDTQVLIDASRWYDQPYLNGKTPVVRILGKIGGENACEALNHKFLEDSEEIAYRRSSDEFDMMSLISAVRRGKCLTDNEINDRLKRFARDMWVTEKVMRPALEILAEDGDVKAKSITDSFENIVFALGSTRSPRVYSDHFNNMVSPVDFLRKRFKQFSALGGSKRELMDIHFRTAVRWLSEMPDELVDTRGWVKGHFSRYGRDTIRSENSTWEGFPETFFDDWRKRVPDLLPEARSEIMLIVLQDVERAYERYSPQGKAAGSS